MQHEHVAHRGVLHCPVRVRHAVERALGRGEAETQAVFSLRGKPLNSFGLSRKVVYENEEFALLQAALGIEEGIEGLRYNRVVLATDADVDGMHIRLLLLTFFLQFFPSFSDSSLDFYAFLASLCFENATENKKSGKKQQKSEIVSFWKSA